MKSGKSRQPVPARAILLEALVDRARELGHTPTRTEWDRDHIALNLRGVSAYERRFGSWTKALTEAGLPPNKSQEFSREQLLEQLRNLSRSLGRKLKREDVLAARYRHTCANLRTFSQQFGSVSSALIAAGVYQSRRTPDRKLLDDLRKLAANLDRPLRTSDLESACKRGKCVSVSTYRSRFGSFPRAMAAAGLVYVPQEISRAELLDYLHRLRAELGRVPNYRDVMEASARGVMPSMMNYSKQFGGLHGALREAKLETVKPSDSAIKETMSEQLRKLTDRLGYAPVASEWKEAYRQGLLPSPHQYWRIFGSLNEARRAAGVTDRVKYREPQDHNRPSPPDRQEVLEYIRRLSVELGRAPRSKDIIAAHQAGARVSYRAVCRTCGGIEPACVLAGIAPQKRNPPKYSPAELLAQLQEFGEQLGRIPTRPVWDAKRKKETTASAKTFSEVFGSWSKALLAAGFPSRSRSELTALYDRGRLLSELRQLSTKLGRVPTYRDLREANQRSESARSETYKRWFGSYAEALKEAGIT